ncbi:hypothetical protein A9Q77_08185 [Marinomonas sp. 42_23_T18]|nr:hypothetical protein A9Q77_08185 [Marinomonas sp. 42_23_T18]
MTRAALRLMFNFVHKGINHKKKGLVYLRKASEAGYKTHIVKQLKAIKLIDIILVFEEAFSPYTL